MIRYFSFSVIVILLSMAVFSVKADIPDVPDIIPAPAKVHKGEGRFVVNELTALYYKGEQLKDVAELATLFLRPATGFETQVYELEGKVSKNTIIVSLEQPPAAELGTEGYALDVRQDNVFITANTTAGLFYGLQTFSQLIVQEQEFSAPVMQIRDYPRFAYRGLHLDVSRHFMPVDFIYKLLDYMAMHKLNVFHWHLIDDQGWRLEIQKYPELTRVGAWRVDMEGVHWNNRPLEFDPQNATYGGYYTQEQVREIVAYAAQRNITVMPEIEMPAHVMSALAAYPHLSCTGENMGVPPGSVWPINHIYCAGNDSVFLFLKDVLTEVMELFPSTYIHIGGDEAGKENWKQCPKCLQRMEDENLEDPDALQSYFIARIEDFLNDHGRRLVGWDEILEGGLAPNATVMSWRGELGGIDAAKMGHQVIMTPGSHCYFDHYQGDPELEPLAIGGFTPLKKVYHYEPVPVELSAQEALLVLGAQANVWTEFMPSTRQVEYMVFPRLAALAEVLWSPIENRNWNSFLKRMQRQYQRYDKLDINYAPSAFRVKATPSMDMENKSLLVELDAQVYNPEIRFTLNGNDPVAGSELYEGPLVLNESAIISAAVFDHTGKPFEVTREEFVLHKAFAANYELEFPPAEQYTGSGLRSLVNGVRGGKIHSDGYWMGFLENDLNAIIDLGGAKNINALEIDALQTADAWIFFPEKVVVEISEDGENYSILDEITHTTPLTDRSRKIGIFRTEKKAENVRYIKVRAQNIGLCPEGHSGAGKPAWLFVSEIRVE